jgi:CBS domain-containing protein
VKLSGLFPDLFEVSRPITTPDVPVIVAASILSIYDSPMLPIVKVGASPPVEKAGIKLFHAIGSQPIIRLLTETKPKNYYKALWNSCTTTSILIGSLGYDDTLDKLLSIFELTGFGDARVDSPPLPPALITLNEVAHLFRERKLKCTIGVKEVASRALAIDRDSTLLDAMRKMCERRVRRLFIEGKEREFISDRTILAFLFSPKGLKVARDSPGVWGDLKVSDIETKKAHIVSSEATVEDVGRLVEPGRDVFILSEGSLILSRWDLVMKPWKAGRLRPSL